MLRTFPMMLFENVVWLVAELVGILAELRHRRDSKHSKEAAAAKLVSAIVVVDVGVACCRMNEMRFLGQLHQYKMSAETSFASCI